MKIGLMSWQWWKKWFQPQRDDSVDLAASQQDTSSTWSQQSPRLVPFQFRGPFIQTDIGLYEEK
ncbi:hypothetical protein TSUD_07880 [Trifolium subterraneum]|uniref:Uncharacterized protein n=1 Tax=Trifolium subterraneum TaxID=3900 RepID=A0A2Z6MNN0_TRISU|nr:hypothetical protein TSUD_07880 [Trifolium subterraneum]